MQKNTMKIISEEYLTEIQNHLAENSKGDEALKAFMEQPMALVHGKPIRSLYMPKIYTKDVLSLFAEIGTTIHSILSKMIMAYKTDPSFRKFFGFPKEMEDWILLPSQYPCALPLVRADIFFNEDDFSFTFCEFNADGASAMNHDAMMYQGVSKTPAFQSMAKKYTFAPFSYFDSWVEAFFADYRNTSPKNNMPTVAIVDFMESAVIGDFYAFQKAFQKAGIEAHICEIRDFVHKNHGLYTKEDIRIDAVYRRSVTGEMYEKRHEIKDFLSAVRENDVCVVGPLSTQVIHNKIIFEILRRPEALSFLTPEEKSFVRRHIPYTKKLSIADHNTLTKEKDNWIIKPFDMYAGKGVFAAKDMTETAWEETLRQVKNTPYLAQHFATPYETLNYDFSLDDKAHLFKNTTGLYLYNSHFTGVLSKAGPNNIVTSSHGAYYMASVQNIKK